jgi:hypothetical protein
MSKVFNVKADKEGNKIIGYSVKSETPMTKKQVITKIEKIKSKLVGDYTFMTCVNTDYGPRDGREFSSKSRVVLCDDYDWDTTESFVIYAWKTPTKSGGCDDIHNDCLYDCIVEMITKFRLPKDYKTPEKLKEYLGLHRDDFISIESMARIETLYKININVFGDYLYTSSTPHPTRPKIELILANGHYELNELKITSGKLGQALTKRQFELVLCDECDGYVSYYDGMATGRMSYDAYLKCKNESRKTGIAYLNTYHNKDKITGDKITIQQAYHILKRDTATLLEITKGKYDLSRSMFRIQELIRKIISKSIVAYGEPEEITQMEQEWFYNTGCNNIIFSSKVELEHGYLYDKRSCFPSVMSNEHFSFPVKQGVFTKINELPTILKFGIYRVNIKRTGNELIDRFFNFNEKHYYTHHHIKTARLLNLPMKLINDGEANALLYSKDRANGHLYFHQTVSELYKLKGQCPLIKELLSTLWGMLCSKYIIKRSSKRKRISLTTEKIQSIRTIGGDDVLIGYTKENKIYRYNYARLGVFLTSCNRLQMTELLLPHTENIFKFHTDGFVSDKPLDLDFGENIGQWKLERHGKCKVNNCNDVKWIQETFY